MKKNARTQYPVIILVRWQPWHIVSGIIPGSRIPGSRLIFSIPNPGIGDALIPGFRDYKNCKLVEITRRQG